MLCVRHRHDANDPRRRLHRSRPSGSCRRRRSPETRLTMPLGLRTPSSQPTFAAAWAAPTKQRIPVESRNDRLARSTVTFDGLPSTTSWSTLPSASAFARSSSPSTATITSWSPEDTDHCRSSTLPVVCLLGSVLVTVYSYISRRYFVNSSAIFRREWCERVGGWIEERSTKPPPPTSTSHGE